TGTSRGCRSALRCATPDGHYLRRGRFARSAAAHPRGESRLLLRAPANAPDAADAVEEEVQNLEGAHHRRRGDQPIVGGVQVEVRAEAVLLVVAPWRVHVEAHELDPASGREAELEVVGDDLRPAAFLLHQELEVEPRAVRAAREMREILGPVEVAHGAD